MAERIAEILNSDSDESEFDGFSVVNDGSDIEIDGLISDDGSDSDSSSTEVSDDENNDGEWTRHFTNLQVRVLK